MHGIVSGAPIREDDVTSRARRWRKRAGCGTSPAMRPSPRNPRAGGMPIALGTMIGVIAGALLGQTTIGFFVGLATGIAVAVLIWRNDRG